MTHNDNAKVAVLRARQLLKDKRYPDALQVCTDELALGADDPELRLIAAHSLLAQGRHEGAKKEAQQVIRQDPEQAEAHRILADVACARGELATACEHLERVMEIDPDDARSRSLLETLSRPSALPAPGGAGLSSAKLRAASLERFVEEGALDPRPARTGPLPQHVPELRAVPPSQSPLASLDVLYGERRDETPPLEISDSMLLDTSESKPRQDQLAARLPAVPRRDDMPPGLRTLHDEAGRGPLDAPPGSGRAPVPMDVGGPAGQRFPGTLRLPAIDDEPDDEEPPTMPLLRPSGPPEPQLKLDPLGTKPVSHEARGASAAPGSTRQSALPLADPTIPAGPPSGMGEPPLVGQPRVPLHDDSFDDFAVEPASVPVAKPPLTNIPQALDPLKAQMRPAAGLDEPTPGPEVIAPDGTGGGLMAMMSGGAPRADDSLPGGSRGDPSFGDDDGWDPEADAMGDDDGLESALYPGARADGTDDAIEHDLIAGFARSAEKKRSGKKPLWITLAVILVLAGGGGYFWYSQHKYIQGEWTKLRQAIYESTPASFKEVEADAKRILEKRSSSPEAKAALAFHAVAMAIEFGEDRLKEAQELLKETAGSDSEWRTAAQGYLSTIDDPDRAAGYLSKGVEVFPESAVLSYLHGRALVASGDLPAAGHAFSKALKIEPKYLAAQVQLAVAMGLQPDGYDQASGAFDRILSEKPDSVQALIERARLNARYNKALGQAAQDAQRVAGELAEKAGRGQLGWAQLVLAQVARRQGDAGAMAAALDAAIKAPPCCDSQYRYELAGELMLLYRYAEAYEQMEAALSQKGKQKDYLLRMARLLLEMERPSLAGDYVRRAPARLFETRLLSAWLQIAQGAEDKAVPQLRQLLAEQPDDLEATLALALALAGERKVSDAEKTLTALAAKLPREHRIPQTLGRVHLLAGAFESADKALRAAWKLNGLDPRTAALLGDVSFKTHDLARAEKRYNTALQRRGDFAPAHIGLAMIRLRTASVQEARRHEEQISPADRESIPAQILAAQIDLAEDKLDAAEQAISRARSAGATDAQLALVRGELALRQGNPAAAVPLLLNARKADPKNVDVLVILGKAQLKAKQDDDAYSTFKDAQKLDSGNPEALLQLGKISILDLEYGFAVKQLTDALEQMKKRGLPQAEQARVFSALGLAYLRKRDTGRAITNLQDAMDLDATAAEPCYTMGLTYDALDRPQRAVGFYEKAIQLDPELVDAYLQLGKAYAKLNDGANAAKYLQAYLSKDIPASKKQEATALLQKVSGQ